MAAAILYKFNKFIDIRCLSFGRDLSRGNIKLLTYVSQHRNREDGQLRFLNQLTQIIVIVANRMLWYNSAITLFLNSSNF